MSNRASQTVFPTRRQLAVFLIAAPLCMLLAEYWLVSPWGSSGIAMLTMPFDLALLVAFPAVFILPFLRFSRSGRAPAFHYWLYALVYSLLCIGAVDLGSRVRHQAFVDLAERSRPLVEAVHQYTARHGQPPPELQALVPEYLPVIPATGMGAYPEYRLLTGERAGHYASNPWVLTVFTPHGFLSFDEFMYYPLHNYPKHDDRGGLERIGEWAYLHE